MAKPSASSLSKRHATKADPDKASISSKTKVDTKKTRPQKRPIDAKKNRLKPVIPTKKPKLSKTKNGPTAERPRPNLQQRKSKSKTIIHSSANKSGHAEAYKKNQRISRKRPSNKLLRVNKTTEIEAAKRKLASKPLVDGKPKSSISVSKLAQNFQQHGIVMAKKPPKFCYVVDGLLAGQGRPTQHGHIQFLCDRGFQYLVTLTLNKPRAIHEYPGRGLQWVHIPIQDETPPSLQQIQTFIALVERAKLEKNRVAVHCAWGRGRTGTMLACYLAKINGFTAQEAIAEIRKLRPGSVDTEKQRMAIENYVDSLRSNN